MKITPQHIGTHVSWDIPHVGTATVRITDADPDHISYLSSDGAAEGEWAGLYLTLDDITAKWRPATPEEATRFEQRYKPAPENWN